MAAPGTCSICKRADADAIDQALAVEGLPVRVAARRFGLGRSAVGRHSKKCLSNRLRLAAEARAGGSDPGLLDRLLTLHDQTLEILAEARKSKSYDLALAAIGRAERQIELEGRLLGQLRDGQGGTTVNVNLDAAAAERIAEVFLARRRGALPPAAVVVETSLAEQDAGAPAPVARQEPG